MNKTKFEFSGFLLFLISILIFFGVLNYFNVLSLSQIYPNIFGFLPHKNIGYLPPLATPSPKIEQKEFYCPASLVPCDGKKVFNSKNKFLGLGFEVPQTLKVRAAVSGEITFEPQASESAFLEIATIVNKQKGYKASYTFIGTRLNNLAKEVTAGQPIGSPSAGTLFKNNGVNLIFRLEDSKGQYVELTSADFQQ